VSSDPEQPLRRQSREKAPQPTGRDRPRQRATGRRIVTINQAILVTMGATLVVLTLSPAGGLAKPTRQVQAIARTTTKMRRSTRKAIKAAGGRDPNRTNRRISPTSLPPPEKKTATPTSTTFNSFFIQQTQNAAYCKYRMNKIKHTSVPTRVDSGKVRRGNKNRRVSTPVSKETLSQTSSTTTTFSNYKTQERNFIYTTTRLTSSTTTTFGNYKTQDHNSIYTTTTM
jgi:hypothetical protein